MSRSGEALLAGALYCLLGGWVGALFLFSVVVAPTAFQVLPSPEVAGKLVGPVLRWLNFYGAAAGLALAAIGWVRGRGPLALALPLILTALCLFSQLGIAAAIEEIRPLAFGQPPDAPALQRFGQLHAASVAIFGTVGILALLLVGVHARADVLRQRGE